MDDFNQIEVPASFLALFTSPGGHRLLQPMKTVRERYELCEDLAQMSAEQAEAVRFRTGGSARDTLAQMQLALSDPASGLAAGEVTWVVTRLAEVLGWDRPDTDVC